MRQAVASGLGARHARLRLHDNLVGLAVAVLDRALAPIQVAKDGALELHRRAHLHARAAGPRDAAMAALWALRLSLLT